MNYTKPNELTHNDDPSDWLNCALIFTRSLSFLLENSEGIIVDLKNDMKFGDYKKVIVYRDNKQVKIVEYDGEEPEGTLTWMHDEEDIVEEGEIGYVGEGMYRIGDGCFTGREGWLDFNKAILKEINEKNWNIKDEE